MAAYRACLTAFSPTRRPNLGPRPGFLHPVERKAGPRVKPAASQEKLRPLDRPRLPGGRRVIMASLPLSSGWTPTRTAALAAGAAVLAASLLILLVVGNTILAGGFLAAGLIVAGGVIAWRLLGSPAAAAPAVVDWNVAHALAPASDDAVAVTDRAGRLVCANDRYRGSVRRLARPRRACRSTTTASIRARRRRTRGVARRRRSASSGWPRTARRWRADRPARRRRRRHARLALHRRAGARPRRARSQALIRRAPATGSARPGS